MAALGEYRRRRHFDITPEPDGGGAQNRSAGYRFVVQKHAASRLHYDFRLELDGALKYWAVRKGPSLNSGDKRLAMQVKDHPLDYLNFEGIIPTGNYGAGTVMLWDRGTFTPQGPAPPLEQWERGELKFELHGEQLRASFALVKMGSDNGKSRPWGC